MVLRLQDEEGILIMSTISSKEISNITGKSHRNITRTIRQEAPSARESHYISKQGKILSMLIVDRKYAEARFLSKFNQNRVYSDRENGAICAIEQLLNITLIRQYPVGSYRIDGYHEESNTAYEIDEPQHFTNGELKQECKDRQAYIESRLGCKFVRIKV